MPFINTVHTCIVSEHADMDSSSRYFARRGLRECSFLLDRRRASPPTFSVFTIACVALAVLLFILYGPCRHRQQRRTVQVPIGFKHRTCGIRLIYFSVPPRTYSSCALHVLRIYLFRHKLFQNIFYFN